MVSSRVRQNKPQTRQQAPTLPNLIETGKGKFDFKFSEDKFDHNYDPYYYYRGIPNVIFFCVEYLLTNCINQEGLFRICGSISQITKAKKLIDKGKPVAYVVENMNPHDVASLLKMFLREQKPNLLSEYVCAALVSVMDMNVEEVDLVLVRKILLTLPLFHYNTLCYLFIFLHILHHNRERNKMDARNISIIFTISICGDTSRIQELCKVDGIKCFSVIEHLIIYAMDYFHDDLMFLLGEHNLSIANTAYYHSSIMAYIFIDPKKEEIVPQVAEPEKTPKVPPAPPQVAPPLAPETLMNQAALQEALLKQRAKKNITAAVTTPVKIEKTIKKATPTINNTTKQTIIFTQQNKENKTIDYNKKENLIIDLESMIGNTSVAGQLRARKDAPEIFDLEQEIIDESSPHFNVEMENDEEQILLKTIDINDEFPTADGNFDYESEEYGYESDEINTSMPVDSVKIIDQHEYISSSSNDYQEDIDNYGKDENLNLELLPNAFEGDNPHLSQVITMPPPLPLKKRCSTINFAETCNEEIVTQLLDRIGTVTLNENYSTFKGNIEQKTIDVQTKTNMRNAMSFFLPNATSHSSRSSPVPTLVNSDPFKDINKQKELISKSIEEGLCSVKQRADFFECTLSPQSSLKYSIPKSDSLKRNKSHE